MRSVSVSVTSDGDGRTKNSFYDKVKYLKDVVTVEPVVACYQMAMALSKPALDNLEFEKSCRVNLNYNGTICNAILISNRSAYEEENARVQTVISVMHSWQQPLSSFMPLILILFLGSFSDRHKLRKPFLLMPLVGELFGNAGELSLEIQGVFQKVIPSLFGGQIMLVMASTSYIADVSTTEMRTLRLGMVQIVISVTVVLVQPISGLFFVKSGYIVVLTTSMVLNGAALTYGTFRIREKKSELRETTKSVLIDIFNPKHAVETVKLPFEKTTENNRALICLFVLTIFVYKCAYDGESSLLYLYTQNVFQWTPLEFSYFLTVNSLVYLIGHTCAVPLFTKVLLLNDFTIMLITLMDKILCDIIFGFARNITVLYIGVVTSVLVRVFTTVKKSIATKIVSKGNIGKAQSLLGICETLAPAISVPFYNRLIYVNTLQTFPAGFFFMSIFLYTLCCCFISLMYRQELKTQHVPKSDMKS